MKTIILAGGYATRLHPLTIDRPKPLLPVAGKPIIDYLFEKGPFPGVPIVSTNRRFAEQFETWKRQSRWAVDLVIEETRSESEKLGTVGALAFLVKALEIDEDVLVIGGDNIFEFSLEELLQAYRGRPLVALYDVGDLDRVRGHYGVAIVREKQVVDFQEKPKRPRSTLASTACYIYPKRILSSLSFFLKQAKSGQDAPGYFNEWLLKNKEKGFDAFVFRQGWYDIGDRAAYIQANQDYSGCDTYTGVDVCIEDSTVLDSVILDDVVIRESQISGSVIDQKSVLEGVCLKDCLVKAGSAVRRTD
jgi:glucose-1-phosphate thymidylyltransferase